MATITGLTAERMLEIEAATVVTGAIVGSHLILTKFDGTTVDTGELPPGPTGPQGPSGVSSIPGEIKAWPGSVLPNQTLYGKWVWADGAVYSATTYPIAASHIHTNWKTAYGQSDPGAGNFRVPDLRGLTLAGLDAMPGGSRANRMTRSIAITIAGKTGEETHIVTVGEMPSHSHVDSGHTHFMGATAGGSGNLGAAGNNTDVTSPDYRKTTLSGTASLQNTGGGGAHENVQPTVFVPYIVRLDG